MMCYGTRKTENPTAQALNIKQYYIAFILGCSERPRRLKYDSKISKDFR